MSPIWAKSSSPSVRAKGEASKGLKGCSQFSRNARGYDHLEQWKTNSGLLPSRPWIFPPGQKGYIGEDISHSMMKLSVFKM